MCPINRIKNNRLLLLAHDPGGANVLAPLIGQVIKRGYRLQVWGLGPAKKVFRDAKVKTQRKTKGVRQELDRELNSWKPALVITGTSVSDETEKWLWKKASQLKIPTVVIIDQWMNYLRRFEWRVKKRGYIFPTRILVSDQIAKEEAVREGIPEKMVRVTGNPYLENLQERANEYKKRSKQTKDRLGLMPQEKLVTFVSEPISQDYGVDYWGFDEKTIFKLLMLTLVEVSHSRRTKVLVVVKLHPREEKNNYQKMKLKLSNNIRWQLVPDINSGDLIMASDLVCGMSSMMLIESVILGVPTVSIQIGLKRQNLLVLDRLGILKTVLNQEKLKKQVGDAMIGRLKIPKRFVVTNRATENIIEEIEKMI